MKESKLQELNISNKVYESAKEQAKNSIKATIKNQMSEWKEIKSFMEQLNYELWREFN